ncbi:MerR family transcriptional regulator [Pseudoalteromonas sp. SMS1]|uniref:MerR family transcriptional regulator n=1 Tax=Pseudoalteromonas sp. SMS1 TaxID=2908894 RepID=UPI001F1EE6D3|nr:MerR family transcriptional regulator [Pseudoalteromonas sp. SMS1]MCF2860144.1 MerR family transcriptional regulator [Pseudoalteromonas sp. SMS1]
MKISELSKVSGVSVRMLRYYEEQGLLAPNRTAAGYRDFGERDVQTLERIKLLNSAGMNLSTVLQFLPCIRGDELVLEPCDELISLLHTQIKLVDSKAKKLAESRKILKHFLDEIEHR